MRGVSSTVLVEPQDQKIQFWLDSFFSERPKQKATNSTEDDIKQQEELSLIRKQ